MIGNNEIEENIFVPEMVNPGREIPVLLLLALLFLAMSGVAQSEAVSFEPPGQLVDVKIIKGDKLKGTDLF